MIDINSALIGITMMILVLSVIYFLYMCSTGAGDGAAMVITIILIFALLSSVIAQKELMVQTDRADSFMIELKTQDTALNQLKKKCET